MKSIILSAFMLISILTNAQQTPANKMFEKYSGQEGYTSIYITKYMFDLFSKVNTEEEDKEFKDVTSKLTAIKILTADNESNSKFNDEFAEILKIPAYKEMMVIKDGKETIKFLIHEANNKISEFLMLVYGDDAPVLIFLEGDIVLKDLSKLSKTMNVNGFEHLDKVEEK